MVELVDARDLKSLGPHGLYGFKSRLSYKQMEHCLFKRTIQISYSCGDGGTKSNAHFVCFDKENITENKENISFQ